MKIDTNLAISKLTDNMSDLAVLIDDIKSVSITHAEFNISQFFTQLDETNNSITSVATTVEKNISSLFIQLDVVYRFALSVQPEVIGMHCGIGLWYRVAHLDMSDPSQHAVSICLDGVQH